MEDLYWEHQQHIKGEGGKIVPFFRNEKKCSTCYIERRKLLEKWDKKVLIGSGWDYESWEYKI
jgi:hypothetical protein